MASEAVAHSELEFVKDCLADDVSLEADDVKFPDRLRRRLGCRTPFAKTSASVLQAALLLAPPGAETMPEVL